MKGQLAVRTPKEYLAKLDPVRRPQIRKLHALIVKKTRLRPYVRAGMIAYGKYHYRYASGREGDWCCIALASNASYISLYALAYHLGAYRRKLPKAKLGKGCIRFRRVEDVDLGVLGEIVKKAAKAHGKTIVS